MNIEDVNTSYSFLPGEVEYALLNRIQEGEDAALILLVSTHVWFIKKLAQAYSEKHNELSYDAQWRNALAVFEDAARTITLHGDQVCFLEEVLKKMEEKHGLPARNKKVTEIYALQKLQRVSLNPISLETPLSDSGEGILLDRIDDANTPSAFETVYNTQFQTRVRPKFKQMIAELLEKREWDVISLHFFGEMDLTSVAEKLDISINQVNGRLGKAFRILKNKLPKDALQ